VSAEQGIHCSPAVEDFIVEECSLRSSSGFRACFAADLMAIIVGMARFEQRTPALEKDEVERALKLYFVH
jgi:hypothetical protein